MRSFLFLTTLGFFSTAFFGCSGFQPMGVVSDSFIAASNNFASVQISAPTAGDTIYLDVGDNLNMSVTVTTANQIQSATWQKFDTTSGNYIKVPGTTTAYDATPGQTANQLTDELILNNAQAASSGSYRASVLVSSLDLKTSQTFYSTVVQVQIGAVTTSPSGTVIPPAAQIVDSSGNVWTLSSGVVMIGGSAAGFSANVTALLSYNGIIYQENNQNAWWSWTNGAWLQVSGDPRGTMTNPTPTPTATPNPTATPKATPLPTATPIVTVGTSIFDCSSGFSASGPCGAALDGYSANSFIADGVPYINGQPAQKLVGSQVELIPSGTYHVGVGFNYQKPVSVAKFTATFTFIPDGYNIAFVLQNNTNTAAGKTKGLFSAGAGCEAGFYQAFPTPRDAGSTNNVFALELAQDQPLNDANGIHGYDGTAPFEYSTAQIFSAGQSPCNPGTTEPNYVYYPHLSTSPVSLNAPYNVANTTTGHVYSVTINYDGSNVTIDMYDTDKSVGGSCPGSKCYTHTWSGVNIAKLVGGSMAYVGLTAGIPSVYSTYPLYVNSFSYSIP